VVVQRRQVVLFAVCKIEDILRVAETLFGSWSTGSFSVLSQQPRTGGVDHLRCIEIRFQRGACSRLSKFNSSKKYFLCLWTGLTGSSVHLPKGLTDQCNDGMKTVPNESRSSRPAIHKKKALKGNRLWVLEKKASQRRKKQSNVRPDTKYTARKRKRAFG